MNLTCPADPGKAVRAECLARNGLSVFQAAQLLGVTRQALNNLVNGHCGISREMAIRLAVVFGGQPEAWLHLQMEYDLAQGKERLASLNIAALSASAVDEQQARLF
ncbi:HigA family addiction module antitoxin [Novosphingobium terrae]|uniref:HigA family addiction module antitoxin n=1 Tax=Novosphingobium terrae TaxID=2726189 RepID=UPI00197EAD73|nr:HigA family addiction module antitoxin [Novosphingobium terrae]